MDMIEKVARAIDPMAWAAPWEDYPAERARREARQAGSLMTARRAIEAMRSPDHDMTAAIVPVGEDRTDAVTVWQAMIDAALK